MVTTTIVLTRSLSSWEFKRDLVDIFSFIVILFFLFFLKFKAISTLEFRKDLDFNFEFDRVTDLYESLKGIWIQLSV